MSDEINTANDFMLGSDGDTIQPLLPMQIRSREQAYRTAAWLVLMAEMLPSERERVGMEAHDFEDIFEAISRQ